MADMSESLRVARAKKYPFEIGDRVKSQWELGRVLAVEPGVRILVQFDEVDSVGWRRMEPPVWRLVYTMRKVSQDIPMHAENEASRRCTPETFPGIVATAASGRPLERLAPVAVGQVPDPGDPRWLAFELYWREHGMRWTGEPMTAAKMNVAVDWWNERGAPGSGGS